MKFSVQNMCPVEGEANVARFLFKLLSPYPSDPAVATLVDSWVDTAFFQLAEGSSKERATVLRALNAALGRNPWLAGPEFSLADIACYCCVLQSASASSAPTNVQRWIKACENLGHFGPAKLYLKWMVPAQDQKPEGRPSRVKWEQGIRIFQYPGRVWNTP